MSKEKVVEEIVMPPQSSVKLERHGGTDRTPMYYTWEIKVYCDNLESALADIKRIDIKLRDEYLM